MPLSPGTVEVRLLTMTPRIDGLQRRPPAQSSPACDRARRVSGGASARRDHERPTAHAGSRLFRRRRCGEDAVQHGLRGPSCPRGRRARRSPLSRRHAPRPLPALAPGDRGRASGGGAGRRGGRTGGPDVAIAYFRAALELVEGEPLANALSGYAWWEAEGHGGRIAAALVDAACVMASLASDSGALRPRPVGTGEGSSPRALQRGAHQGGHAGGGPKETPTACASSGGTANAALTSSTPAVTLGRGPNRSTASCPVGSSSVPDGPTSDRPPDGRVRLADGGRCAACRWTTSSRRATRLPFTSAASPGPERAGAGPRRRRYRPPGSEP